MPFFDAGEQLLSPPSPILLITYIRCSRCDHLHGPNIWLRPSASRGQNYQSLGELPVKTLIR
jgi:hypothetical protein